MTSTFGATLQQHRKKAGMTLEQLAEAASSTNQVLDPQPSWSTD